MDDEKLSFRDRCAVAAMQSVLSNDSFSYPSSLGVTAAIVLRAFDVADAMVAEREKRDAATKIYPDYKGAAK